MVEKRQFPHHLIREIFEQPDGLRRTIEPRVSLEQGVVRLEEVQIPREELRAVRSINIIASGTSRHAGIAGQFMAQELAGMPTGPGSDDVDAADGTQFFAGDLYFFKAHHALLRRDARLNRSPQAVRLFENFANQVMRKLAFLNHLSPSIMRT